LFGEQGLVFYPKFSYLIFSCACICLSVVSESWWNSLLCSVGGARWGDQE